MKLDTEDKFNSYLLYREAPDGTEERIYDYRCTGGIRVSCKPVLNPEGVAWRFSHKKGKKYYGEWLKDGKWLDCPFAFTYDGQGEGVFLKQRMSALC